MWGRASLDRRGTRPAQLHEETGYQTVWSPEGKQLVFKIFVSGHWRLGLIQADGTGFQFIGKLSPTDQDYESPAWAVDGKSLYTQSLTNIYRIDLSGKVLVQWKISESLLNADMNSIIGSNRRPTTNIFCSTPTSTRTARSKIGKDRRQPSSCSICYR